MAIGCPALYTWGEVAGFPVERTTDDDTTWPHRKNLMKVSVVGAGPSGLAALKAVQGLRSGSARIEVECFEQTDRIGGLWTLHHRLGKTSAYRSLHINTSRERTQFSDFPMPTHYPDYPAHSQMCAYLEAYAAHFALTPSIRLNTSVLHVRPLDARYELTLSNGESVVSDAVIVANGHHADPYWPELPGRFDGALFHASDYLDPDHPVELRAKRVLVVGLGNSAMDIAAELAYAGASVTVSARRGAHIIPKWVGGKPVDQTSLLPGWVPRRLRRRVAQRLLELSVGDLTRFGLPKPDHALGEAHPTLSNEMPHLIRTRRVAVKPAVVRLEGNRVHFSDGTDLELDAIVICTGYNVRFPFFDPDFVSAPDNRLPLFFRVHKPGVPKLFFIGLCQTVGAILPIAEAQAAWVAAELAGEYSLPPTTEMWRTIQNHERGASGYVSSRRHTMQVDPDVYLRALEQERQRGYERALGKLA
jgi:cation diffusion facilitator CzcD-associated flavoprotein CzcO